MLLAFLILLLGAVAPSAGQAGCTLQLSAGAKAFDKCVLVEGVGSNFHLLWTLSQDGSQVAWGINATVDGYIGVGFPLQGRGNAMVGTNAFLMQTCSSCPTGAQLRQVHMSGTGSGDIHPDDAIAAEGMAAEAHSDGWLLATVTTPLLSATDAYMVISAAGSVYRNGNIRYHSTFQTTELNLLTAQFAQTKSYSKPISALVAVHIWLLLVGWGFLAPLGVLAARSLKHKDPLWFKLHRALMMVGLLLGVIGLALGFIISGGWNGLFTVHRNLGMASILMGALQAPAIAFRPKLTSKYRRIWNVCHWWNGRAAVVLGVANIYYGLTKIVDTGSYGWGIYTAVFSTIVFAAIAKESWEYVQLPPPGVMAKMATDGSQDDLVGHVKFTPPSSHLGLVEMSGGVTSANGRV